jgi:hypothetical protein
LALLLGAGTPARAAEPSEKVGGTAAGVAYVNGRLSVNVKDAGLDGVLKEIGAAIKARVDVGGGTPIQVSTSFSNLSLEEGLVALMKDTATGVVLCYDGNGAVTLISLSLRAGDLPDRVCKVKKVRSYFSPRDQASGLSMGKVRKLMAILRDPKQKGRWVVAAKQIMNIKNPEAKPYLKELITHEHDFVREEAAWEYAMLVDAQDADFILALAEDQAWQNRSAAAEIAMPLIDDPRQIPILIRMLQDSHTSVSDAAIGALGRKRAQAAVPYLQDLLKTGSYSARAKVAEALHSITNERYEWKTPDEKALYEQELKASEEEFKKKRAEFEKQAR